MGLQSSSICCLTAGVACGGAVIPLACLLFWRKATGLAACIGEGAPHLP